MRRLALPCTLVAALSGAAFAFASATTAPPAQVGGTWAYDAPALRVQMSPDQPAIQCGMVGVTVTFEQRDSVLTGTTRGGTLRCQGQPERPITSDPVGSAVVRGDSVVFRIGQFAHRGRVARGRIEGRLTNLQHPITGEFQMIRQP